MSLTANKAFVRAVYPEAFAIEAVGSGLWRVYKADLKYDDRLTGGCDTEEEAWDDAAEFLAALPVDKPEEK